jgi:ribosomal protein S21
MKYNFGVKNSDIKIKKNSNVNINEIMVKIFLKKWKKSGIVKELREKRYHESKGEKRRRKKNQSKKRLQKNNH